MVIRGLEVLRKKYKNVILTIGNFDGVHIGHQKIFGAVAEKAKSLRGTAMAITFDPHPVRIVAPEKGLRILTAPDEKLRLMEQYGMDIVLCINFSREFASMEAADFVREVIAGRIGAETVIVGHDYAFGKGKKGTTGFLRKNGKRFGFDVKVIRNARLHGSVVSSSRIRGLLDKGRVKEAGCLLGRPYMIKGKVIKGANRGARLLHIPTANISAPEELVPMEGVYAVKAAVGKKIYDAVANIGRNPTFGENPQTCEVHLLDFSGSLLEKNIRVYFFDRIRGEKAFSEVSALRHRILKDIDCARDILKNAAP